MEGGSRNQPVNGRARVNVRYRRVAHVSEALRGDQVSAIYWQIHDACLRRYIHRYVQRGHWYVELALLSPRRRVAQDTLARHAVMR